MRKEPNVWDLKCKLRLAQRKIRSLKSSLKAKEDELEFKEAALVRSTHIICALDHDGKLWNALMSGALSAPKGAEK